MKRVLLICSCLLSVMAYAVPSNNSLEFVRNAGQWEGPFLYKAIAGNGHVYLERNTFTYVISAADNDAKIEKAMKGKALITEPLNFHCYKMIFEGGNVNPTIEESKIQQHYYNYFLGNDPSKWKSAIHPALALDYHNMYKNIDVHLSSDGGNMKYDLIVRPGADISQLRMKYTGTTGLNVRVGKLIIGTTVGKIEELKPYAYQIINGERTEIACRYKLEGETVSFTFPDGYDTKEMLVIDPTVVFATFTGSSTDNWGYTATYDAAGNFYAGGIASDQNLTGYPTTTGAFQTTFAGGDTKRGNIYPADIAITKFSATGTSLLYSTYIGGASNEQPHSMIVDPTGNLIVVGRSYSTNFPTTPGCFDATGDTLGDMVVIKFNSTGTGLIGSTYVGGTNEDVANYTSAEFGWGNLKHNYGDDARSEVIIDNAGNVYVAACTKSTNFPTVNASKTTLTGGDIQDAVVLKLNSALTSLLWSTYLGGTSDDAAYVIALDKTESQVFVAGGTMSSNFPATSGSYQSTYQGGIDGFIARFQNSGTYALQKATYIGRSGYDQCYGLQIDNNNNVYTMGQTMGGTFPVSPGVYSNPGSSQFVMKLDNNLNSNLLSTVYGSGNSSATNISPVAFLIDTCENIYISGWGGNIYGSNPPTGTGNTFGMPLSVAPNPPAQSTTDGADFYFIVLSKNMAALQYATYMGSTDVVGEHVDGGTSRFDKNGVVYQAICGGCGAGTAATFPTTTGVWSAKNKSNNCNLVALKIAFNFGPVKAGFTLVPNKTLCLGDAVTVTNTSSNATGYFWDFGDGFTTTVASPGPHIYTTVGTFTVKLRATNPLSCNLADSTTITVKVDTNRINAAFTAAVIDTCFPFTGSFVNTSKQSQTPANTVYSWNFGDGSTPFVGQNPGTHNFPKGGTYTITLTMTDPTSCNTPDSATATLTFKDDLVKAAFETGLICVADSFRPLNKSSQAVSYAWDFGDGKTSTNANPAHKYDTTGFFKVRLIAFNPTTCNKVDSTTLDVEVKPSPTSEFTFTPLVPVTNEPNRFTNKSKDASLYNWNFGDGTGSQENNPEHFYKRTGTYNVCLIASNKEGCSDTTCHKVSADVRPLADIPNAFSPNGDGKNDILYVRGAAIDKINLKIYNRWGQMVFESNDIKDGWDGTYNGKPQEVEAYGYVLNVTFVDETTLYKRGNVTLLR